MPSFAQKQVLQAEKMWSGHPPPKVWVQGDPRLHFVKLDFQWYDDTARTFEGLGFRFAADTEDLNATEQAPYARAFTREMLSGDGTTVASFYHFHLRGWRKWLFRLLGIKTNRRIVNLVSEMEDETYLTTSTAQDKDSFCPPPWSYRESMPAETSPETLWKRHRERLGEHAETAPQRQPIGMANYGEVHGMQVRYHVRHCQHVHTPGILAREIFRQATPGQAQAATQLAEQITVLQMERGFRPLDLETALRDYPPPKRPARPGQAA
ncbi:MAG: hypothetical protein RLY93_01135 [Sumerlaeia bacterium]